jgi:probable phosphoglycerate mutase
MQSSTEATSPSPPGSVGEDHAEAAGTIVVVTDTVAGATSPAETAAETEGPPGGTEATGSTAPSSDGAEPQGGDEQSGEAAARKPPPPVTLLLARHAVTEETGSMLSGRKPGIDLSEKGREQAAALGDRLSSLPLAAIYASPIERTMQTAEAVAAHHGLTVRELPGVIEADYGGWTGGKLGDLAKEDLWRTVQRAPSRARFPDGESLAEMQVRMVAALETVVAEHPGEIVLVVSHADPIKSAIAHYTGAHLDHFQRIVVSPASVTVFQLSPHGAAMVKCNDTGSLDELVPRASDDATAEDATTKEGSEA